MGVLPFKHVILEPVFNKIMSGAHTVRLSLDCFPTVNTLPWPAKSPDLSPIEHVSDMIRHQIQAPPKYRRSGATTGECLAESASDIRLESGGKAKIRSRTAAGSLIKKSTCLTLGPLEARCGLLARTESFPNSCPGDSPTPWKRTVPSTHIDKLCLFGKQKIRKEEVERWT
ncbi:hypothetical protein TNCV_4106051 [Trichonephila clavipes]|nr:hypothetical protein TNCV_4106051 [Trichonephila clavipes]